MRRGCFICGKVMDTIFIFSTPKDRYKVCHECFETAKFAVAIYEVIGDREIKVIEEN